MKNFIGSFCLVLAVAAFVPMAHAQQGQLDSTDGEVRRLVDQALRDRFSAGDQDAAIISQDGQVTGLSGALTGEEEEKKVRYKYDKKKGIFEEAELPPRTFNNIPYPY